MRRYSPARLSLTYLIDYYLVVVVVVVKEVAGFRGAHRGSSSTALSPVRPTEDVMTAGHWPPARSHAPVQTRIRVYESMPVARALIYKERSEAGL